MSRRPSIQLAQFQYFAPQLAQIPPNNSPLKPITKGVKASKRPLSRPISSQVRKINKVNVLHEHIQDREKEQESVLLMNQSKMKADDDHQQGYLQVRSKSLQQDNGRGEKGGFRIHHNRSMTKSIYAHNKVNTQSLPFKDKQKNSSRKQLTIEGKGILSNQREQRQHHEVSQLQKVKLTKTFSDPFALKKIQLKSKGAQFKLSFKSKQNNCRQINQLVKKARLVSKSHELFKMPQDKERILEVKLRQTVKNDVDGRKHALDQERSSKRTKTLNQGMNVKGLKKIEHNTKIDQSSNNGQRKGTMPWKKKREEQLMILKGRMGEVHRHNLILR